MTRFGGIYNPSNPPARAGLFVITETQETLRPRTGSAGVAGILGEADWGPHNELVDITSTNQAINTYGTSGTLTFAVTRALLGEGRLDRSGASMVKAYRIAAASANEATLTLQNTTPANALRIDAKYVGTRGNAFRITTQTNAIDATRRDLLVYEGTTIRERYTYVGAGATILAALAADINATSNYVTATVLLDALPLAAVANAALTGGDSGATVIAGDHTTAMAAFESDSSMTTFAVDDWVTLDTGIKDEYRDWVVRITEEGVLAHMVVGGLAGETVATAVARSTYLDTPDGDHIYGMGDVFVNTTRDLTIGGVDYSSSQLAPVVAGILASADANRAIVGSIVTDARLVNPPGSAEIEALIRGGVIPYTYDGTNVKLQRDVTAYGVAVAPAAAKSAEFQELSFVRRLWFTYRALNEVFVTQIEGTEIVNSPSSRETILLLFNAKLAELEESNRTIPGAYVVEDPDAVNTGRSITLLFSYRPASSISTVLARISIPV